MRKLIQLIIGIAMVALFAACTPATEINQTGTDSTSPAGSETSGGTATESKEIALFMTHMSNEFTITLSNAVKAQVEERGYTFRVYDAQKDAERQQTQIEQAVGLGVGAIVIEPVSVDGVVPAVRAANQAGVNIIIVNQRISEPDLAAAYIGADAVKTGRIVMEQVAEDLGNEGDLALLLGPMGSDGQVGRSAGFQEIIDANEGFQVVFDGAANWETAPALTMVENWLNSGKNIDAIVSQNDGMAIGAAQAVQDAGLGDKVKIYGVDATSEGLQAVIDGRMTATIGQGTSEQGRLAADAAADLIEGKDVEAETIVENEVFTQENAQEALDAIKNAG